MRAARRLQSQPPSKLKQATLFIDKVTEEACKKFMFRSHDVENCLYRQILDPSEIRLQISQVMRDIRKSIIKGKNQAKITSAKKKQEKLKPEAGQSATMERNRYTEYSNEDLANLVGLDPRRLKRFKTDDNGSNGFGGFC